MKRFARWLRLVVTCLAFVIGSPSPALAVELVDQVVCVADARDDSPAEIDCCEKVINQPAIADFRSPVTSVRGGATGAPRAATRLFLANCALLL